MRTRLSKKEELLFDLWEKLTPEMDWHGGGTTAEDSNEVILEGLDGFSAMLRWCSLGGTSSYVMPEASMAALFSADA